MGTDNIEILINELDALANVDLHTRQEKAQRRHLNIIRVGTSGSLQEDIPLGAQLVSHYSVGLDTLMYFYALQQTEFEMWVGEQLQEALGLSFLPYCVEGSAKLRKAIGAGMFEGNTVTCPGFYAPQGRKLRAELRYPGLVDGLSTFRQGDFRLTNFEMETAGYYSLGRILGHEVLSVNAIIANRITQQFAPNAGQVVDDLIKTVLDRVAAM
jgi:uridine phosphorylase